MGAFRQRIKTKTGTVERWYARVQHAGRTHSRRCESKADAEATSRRWRDEIKAHRLLGTDWLGPDGKKAATTPRKVRVLTPEPQQRTVGDLVRAYRKVAPDCYRGALRIYQRDLGHLPLPPPVESLDLWYAEYRRAQKTSTANQRLRVLKTMLYRAQSWGWIDSNPAAKVARQREPDLEPRHLYGDEEERLLAAIKQPVFRAAIVFALNTGLRRAELFGMPWDWIDLGRRLVVIPGDKTKGKRPRRVRINKAAIAAIKSVPRSISTDRVFHLNGRPFSKGQVDRLFAAARKAARLVGVRFHDLRHTFCARLFMARTPTTEVQQVMGHRKIETTMRYAVFAPEETQGATDRLDSFVPPRRTAVEAAPVEAANC